ncbi:MAG: DNA alkylation repair protein [Eubacteriales bacterium]|nr:DNA alkylation repair protein [Eubacteriales bacterium]MDY3332622.1 DNA alkylation repair protein [Gallibacter sp.]
MDITKELFDLRDEKYADFSSKLIPNIERDRFIGVRIPAARALAKSIVKNGCETDFLKQLPHHFYDENILHSLIISEIKDYELCVKLIDSFLPYIDNWAVCDILSPVIFKKNKKLLISDINRWLKYEAIYTKRFAVVMLMSHFLDRDFSKEYLKSVADIKTDEYYLQMVIAWYFATALAKQWDDTIVYIENNIMDEWIHNKTIQKARESRRVSDEQKEYLKTLKR